MNVSRIRDKKELEAYVMAAFSGDQVLLNKYHIKPGQVTDCTLDTVDRIVDSSEKMRMSCYGFEIGTQKIGFVAMAPGLLYSFGLNINHRDSQTVGQWWKWIEQQLGGIFSSVMNKKNKPAIGFLKKQGMKVIRKNEETIHLYKSK